MPQLTLRHSIGLALLALLAACSGDTLNNPYPARDSHANVLYKPFSERPKHLDPAQSFSATEAEFTAQIYEPVLQYHYLKRPYAYSNYPDTAKH